MPELFFRHEAAVKTGSEKNKEMQERLGTRRQESVGADKEQTVKTVEGYKLPKIEGKEISKKTGFGWKGQGGMATSSEEDHSTRLCLMA